MPTQIPAHISSVLSQATLEGLNLTLPANLDRKLYQQVNAVLDTIGVVWSRKLQKHVCVDDRARQKLELLLGKGTYTNAKKEFQLFETPRELAERMAKLAVREGDHVLEPSCGTGRLMHAAIAAEAYFVLGIDINPEAIEACQAIGNRGIEGAPKKAGLRQADFLTYDFGSERFDSVIMNPPFSNLADVEHVMRAYHLLKPGGRLVAVMCPAYQTSKKAKAVAFRNLLTAAKATVEDLPDGSFRESGTNVRTVLVQMTSNLAPIKKTNAKKAPKKVATA